MADPLDSSFIASLFATVTCQIYLNCCVISAINVFRLVITLPILTSNNASLLSICANAIFVALANNKVWCSSLCSLQ